MHSEYLFYPLSKKNFLSYCQYHYENESCLTEDEFHSDLKCAKSVRRIIKRKLNDNSHDDRLVLNYIILLSNVFGILPSIRILFHVCEKELYCYLKEYLKELDYLSDYTVQFLKKYDNVEL